MSEMIPSLSCFQILMIRQFFHVRPLSATRCTNVTNASHNPNGITLNLSNGHVLANNRFLNQVLITTWSQPTNQGCHLFVEENNCFSCLLRQLYMTKDCWILLFHFVVVLAKWICITSMYSMLN